MRRMLDNSKKCQLIKREFQVEVKRRPDEHQRKVSFEETKKKNSNKRKEKILYLFLKILSRKK
jgi:hypothetical protein